MRNGEALALTRVPSMPWAGFRLELLRAVNDGARVAALFGAPEGGGLRLYAVLAEERVGGLSVLSTTVGDSYPSLTPACPQVHWFEREIAEQWGVKPEGHPWLKPIRFHPSWRPGKDAWGRQGAIEPCVTDYYRVEGGEIHEVAVGPVHAGIIEPGHFRFQCHGEKVFHLEISLGYQHRGVERAMAGGPSPRSVHYMETLAGDTTVAHATAYAQIVEALSGQRAPARAMALRGVALELERLANHTGDLGALANDVGFLPTSSFCGRIRGDFLNMTALLCGNRFGRNLVRPGGVAFDLDDALAEELRRRLAAAVKDVTVAAELLWSTPSVMARFETTGVVSRQDALDAGLVGVAARASGLDRDVRQDFPTGIFAFEQIPAASAATGDVFARAYVRWIEMRRSARFITELSSRLPAGPLRRDTGPLRPNMLAAAMVEGWRGEVCHVALTDGEGRFARYKVVDPSFHNWFGLALSLRGQEISDFPLCNKSFNLSYCGHDL